MSPNEIEDVLGLVLDARDASPIPKVRGAVERALETVPDIPAAEAVEEKVLATPGMVSVDTKDQPLTSEAKQDLDRQLILKYVPTNAKRTRKWIKTLKNKREEDYLKKRLAQLVKYWNKQGRLDLIEQYEIFRRGLRVDREVPISGAYGGKKRFIPFGKKETYYYYSKKKKKKIRGTRWIYANTIRILAGDVPFSINQASGMKDNFVKYPHYSGNDQKWKVDIRRREAGGNLVWYGPARPFKVLQAAIRGPDDISRYHGSRIKLMILNDNWENWQALTLVHFSAIHKEIYDADAEKVFAPGTFLGMTMRFVGWTTGLHLHISSGNPKFRRDKIYTLWTGNKTKRKP
jgi:hypothetical protein